MLPPTGRKKELRPTLLEDFKTLVAEQGMSADTISIKEDKGIKLYSSHQRGFFFFNLTVILVPLGINEMWMHPSVQQHHQENMIQRNLSPRRQAVCVRV